MTLRQVFTLGRPRDDRGPLHLAVPHQSFATALWCSCPRERHPLSLYLFERLSPGQRTCAVCGGRLRAAGTDLVEWLPEADVPSLVHDTPLVSLGFWRGDVLTVAGATQAAHLQIGGVA